MILECLHLSNSLQNCTPTALYIGLVVKSFPSDAATAAIDDDDDDDDYVKFNERLKTDEVGQK